MPHRVNCKALLLFENQRNFSETAEGEKSKSDHRDGNLPRDTGGAVRDSGEILRPHYVRRRSGTGAGAEPGVERLNPLHRIQPVQNDIFRILCQLLRALCGAVPQPGFDHTDAAGEDIGRVEGIQFRVGGLKHLRPIGEAAFAENAFELIHKRLITVFNQENAV